MYLIVEVVDPKLRYLIGSLVITMPILSIHWIMVQTYLFPSSNRVT